MNIRPIVFYLFLLTLILIFPCLSQAQTIGDYNVVWRSPSSDASGAMPLGNGELGINLWVEPSGDLLFYLSRTDSWSETGRLLKLGKVRVSLSPNLFAAGYAFTQRLNLQQGTIEITGEQGKERTKLTVFTDPGAPVLHLLCTSSRPVNVTATSEPWRTAPYDIPKEDSLLGINSAWPRTGTYDYTQAVESADQPLSDPDAVVWYHRNEHSTYPLTLDLMELHSLASRFDDPLLHRTFGVRMSGAGFVKRSPLEIATVRPVKHFDLRLATCTAQTPDIATWEQQLRATERSAANGRKALAANRQWWKNFWDKSFIFVETPDIDTGFRITQSYLLQNWMSACGGRGAYPIKFNGGIFTVDPVFTDAKIRANADHRNWGGDYWWQNTRLMYYPMLASGDFEMMLPLFRFYQDRLASFRTIASEYMDAEGAVIPETSSIFGLYRPGDYGWDRTGRQKGDIRNMYVRHAWNGSLELVSMMLDYYDYTGDTAFVRTRLVPVATEVLRYFDTKFPKDADGTIRITPTQALETYWYDMVNDLPCVAGLHAVLPRLLALPHGTAALPEQARWNRMQRQLPPMSVEIRDGQKRFAPAEQYDPKKNNTEVPELYGVFPFDLCNFTTPDAQIGIDTYNARTERGFYGWRQDGQMAALLGLTEQAAECLAHKTENSHPNHRFPAYWGPNFDWTPDQNHGGNLLTTLQTMVLQSHGNSVYLLPAFPKRWNVRFRLHTRGRGIAEGSYRNGKWETEPALKGASGYTLKSAPGFERAREIE